MTFLSIAVGSVAEWVSGLGTVAAVVFTGVQVRRSRLATETARRQTDEALRLQHQLRADDLLQRERSQASLISCTMSGNQDGFNAAVMNHSSATIYDVVMFGSSSQYQQLLRWPVQAEVLPGTLPRIERMDLDGAYPDPSVIPDQTGITFRDNDGRQWVKWGNGRLEPRASARIVVAGIEQAV